MLLQSASPWQVQDVMPQEKFMVPPRGGIGERGPTVRGTFRYPDFCIDTARSCTVVGSPATVPASDIVDVDFGVSAQPTANSKAITHSKE
jgi:hypothetical protein